MDIREAKQQVMTTVKAYLARDGAGLFSIPPAEQRPIFLLGAPGIGKTAIMAQVADELGIGLVSYSMTHHTRQSALGLPLIVHRTYRGGEEFDISEYTMSEIIASIYDYMEESGVDNGILFLDEINCVSETLYPSMLQFLQFKTFGRHRVPEGWIVVCAGNPPEYNRSVNEFDIVTMDRLRRIDVEPSLDAWGDFAREQQTHPAILTYLELRPDDFYLVESTPEGKQFVSARAWSELSGLMLLLEQLGLPVDGNVFAQYLQHPEIATRFSDYYELFRKYRSDYQVESILDGDASAEIVQRAQSAAFDERLALLSLMLDALSMRSRSAVEGERALQRVRDTMRTAKGFGDDAQGMREMLRGAAIEARKESAGQSENPSARAQARVSSLFAGALEGLGACSGYDEAEREYRDRVAELQAGIDATRAAIDNAYAFIDGVFGEGGEALVFTTELTARHDSSQFIARFGSDSYFDHSERLATDSNRDAIFDEIDALR